ncbi:MAG TPA: glycerol-3-phosphate dehydrogenase, partial [Candidatus Polarisedimenticolia bacterium]|nr:glycerol-3-phosphate dehydrogenase [Candidatus Polarisedimenticolia bacterium]
MRAAVLGGGGWGTTLALLLESKGHDVRLWVYEADEAERMARTRENTTFLPGVPIPSGIEIINDRAKGAGGRGEHD